MFRNLIQFYSMAVCYTASITAMITISLMINSITDLVFLETKVYDRNNKNLLYESATLPNNYSTESGNTQELREESKALTGQNYIRVQRSYAITSILNEIGWLVSVGLFFLVHWKLYERYREDIINSSAYNNFSNAVDARERRQFKKEEQH